MSSNIVSVEIAPFSIYGSGCLCTYDILCDIFSYLFYTRVSIFERSCHCSNDAHLYGKWWCDGVSIHRFVVKMQKMQKKNTTFKKRKEEKKKYI